MTCSRRGCCSFTVCQLERTTSCELCNQSVFWSLPGLMTSVFEECPRREFPPIVSGRFGFEERHKNTSVSLLGKLGGHIAHGAEPTSSNCRHHGASAGATYFGQFRLWPGLSSTLANFYFGQSYFGQFKMFSSTLANSILANFGPTIK